MRTVGWFTCSALWLTDEQPKNPALFEPILTGSIRLVVRQLKTRIM